MKLEKATPDAAACPGNKLGQRFLFSVPHPYALSEVQLGFAQTCGSDERRHAIAAVKVWGRGEKS